ncbi:hypothetical protein [Amedibacillus sp. YH-ame10]
MGKLEYIIDGSIIDREILEGFKIPVELISETSNGVYSNFVGVLFFKGEKLVSFPKHFLKNMGIEESMMLILKVLKKYALSKSYNEFDEKNEDMTLLSSINYIVNYFNAFGLHFNEYYTCSNENNGRVNWKSTIIKSAKIISNDNLVFFPLFTYKKNREYSFVGDCMKIVLNYVIDNCSFLYHVNHYKKFMFNETLFENNIMVISLLKELLHSEFKDINKRLIKSLIDFFRYRASSSITFKAYTKDFENIWEDAVEDYLNEQFSGCVSNNYSFDGVNKVKFKKETFRIDYQQHSPKSISIDHFAETPNDVYIFDSKYYKEMHELNYKQVSYHYFIDSLYKSKIIHNGLIMPTEEERIYEVCHIDRKEVDGLYISEIYLPCAEVLSKYAE